MELKKFIETTYGEILFSLNYTLDINQGRFSNFGTVYLTPPNIDPEQGNVYMGELSKESVSNFITEQIILDLIDILKDNFGRHKLSFHYLDSLKQ